MTSFPRHRDRHPAPVFLIRDACTDAGVGSPDRLDQGLGFQQDVVSIGLVPLPTAHTLVRMYVFPHHLQRPPDIDAA